MVLHASGTIFASQIRNEFNQNTSGTFFLGSVGRTLDSRVPQSGQVTFSNFYNKYFKPASGNLKVWLDGKEYSGSGTTWTDLQGNANGTLVNTPTYSKPFFEFNGTSQYVTLPDITNITDFTTSENYTISCWAWIASTQNDGTYNDNSILEKWASSGSYPYAIRYSRGGRQTVSLAFNPTNGSASVTSSSIIQNEWNHLSVVFNWSTLTLSSYINGALNSSSSISNIGTINNSSLLYLMSRGGSRNYLTGRLGMLMIHDKALSAIEISRLYYSTRNIFEVDSTELENGTWNVVYEYTNPKRNASNALVTSKDNAASLGSPTVNRIGYFMQNNMNNGNTSYWVFVTMDAYTSTLSQIKIPDLVTSFTNQRNVSNLRVYSNHPQVGNYHAANGRLEIWPWNYGFSSNLGGGSTTFYDFDDTTSGTGNYGCVQVHDISNSKTLLAWNEHRYNVGTSDIGIGNNDATNIHYNTTGGAAPNGSNPDWTFSQNGAYNWKFQVLVGTVDVDPLTLETGTWRLLYEITNPKRNSNGVLTYTKNNSALLGGNQFSKVGYYMQNNMGNGATAYYAYVTMDAYTTSLGDLKIPDLVDNFTNKRGVQNISVYSNHPQVGNYTANTGRLEIWPGDYNFIAKVMGNDGGGYTSGTYAGGAGGGGATQVGFGNNDSAGGNGGQGYTTDITGTSDVYGSGGGGGSRGGGNGIGGTNAGNGGAPGGSGVANRGGGGGGGEGVGVAGNTGGSGGSGIVVIRYDTTDSLSIEATGGDSVVTTGNYKSHLFTNIGSNNFVITKKGKCDILIVGGGGGGGGQSGSFTPGGGGGGGQVIHLQNYVLDASTYPITVGNGGIAGNWGSSGGAGNGGNSSFGSITSIGGGGGGGGVINSKTGGSGGGGQRGGPGASAIAPSTSLIPEITLVYVSTSVGWGNRLYSYDDTTFGLGTYGSVQIHDITNSKSLIAWNNHKSDDASVDIGIGNNDASNIHYNTTGGAAPNGTNPDWTNSANGAYNWKFQVYVKV